MGGRSSFNSIQLVTPAQGRRPGGRNRRAAQWRLRSALFTLNRPPLVTFVLIVSGALGSEEEVSHLIALMALGEVALMVGSRPQLPGDTERVRRRSLGRPRTGWWCRPLDHRGQRHHHRRRPAGESASAILDSAPRGRPAGAAARCARRTASHTWDGLLRAGVGPAAADRRRPRNEHLDRRRDGVTSPGRDPEAEDECGRLDKDLADSDGHGIDWRTPSRNSSDRTAIFVQGRQR